MKHKTSQVNRSSDTRTDNISISKRIYYKTNQEKEMSFQKTIDYESYKRIIRIRYLISLSFIREKNQVSLHQLKILLNHYNFYGKKVFDQITDYEIRGTITSIIHYL